MISDYMYENSKTTYITIYFQKKFKPLFVLQYWKYLKKPLEEAGMNPVQWASTMLDESTPCDIILLMALRDLTDVSK